MSGGSYETFLKAFKEMLEAIWLRNFEPIPDDPMEGYDWLWERELEHELAAEEKTLAESQAPRSKRLSRQDRLHMKYAGTKPGINEKAVSERTLRRKPEPAKALPQSPRRSLTEDLSALVQIAGPEVWRSAGYLVEKALGDAQAFRSVVPTQAQKRILHAAAVALYSDLTERAICEASDVSEKTLRQWVKLLGQYDDFRASQESEMEKQRKDRINRHLLAEGWPGLEKNGKN